MLHQDEYLSDLERAILDKTFGTCLDLPQLKADLFIYLRSSPDVILERIRARKREGENCISLNYLQRKLHFNCVALFSTLT